MTLITSDVIKKKDFISVKSFFFICYDVGVSEHALYDLLTLASCYCLTSPDKSTIMNIVHIKEVHCMNTIVTSREAILAESRKLVMEKGIDSVNMRSVAAACNVAVGSIYNYFPSKADLISAAVEDVWKDIFHMSGESMKFEHFTDCLAWLYERIQKGCEQYPGFFTLHSVSFAAEDKSSGRRMMEKYFAHIRQNLLHVLAADPLVREDAFDDQLSAGQFVDMIFTLLTSLLLQNQKCCEPLLVVAARCIYEYNIESNEGGFYED